MSPVHGSRPGGPSASVPDMREAGRDPLPAARGTELGTGELPAPVAVTGHQEMGWGRCWAAALDAMPTLQHPRAPSPGLGLVGMDSRNRRLNLIVPCCFQSAPCRLSPDPVLESPARRTPTIYPEMSRMALRGVLRAAAAASKV